MWLLKLVLFYKFYNDKKKKKKKVENLLKGWTLVNEDAPNMEKQLKI